MSVSHCKTAVIVPTYNESENLPDLVRTLLALPLDLRIVVVDDHSPDGTGEIADRLSATTGRVTVIHRPRKLGLGTAYTAGFRHALDMNMDYIVTMDADFSHDPRYIPALAESAASYDVVVGSRYVPGGGVQLWGWERRLMSWGANTLARLALGLRTHDCTAGFRCYRREVLAAIGLDQVKADGYSYLIEMLFRCERRGFRIGEVPIIFVDRRAGASKISRQEILKAGWTILRLLKHRIYASPTLALANVIGPRRGG
jgi:glycosyltransferase involved in cell wall biosynthesis